MSRITQHRFDHTAALAFYVSLEPRERTDARVAAQFGVTDRTIAKWRKRNGWEKTAADADRRAAEKALAAAIKTREQRTAQVLRIFDAAADRVETAIALDKDGKAVLDVDVVFAKFPELHRLYRLEIGESTDHVALAEVQAGFRTAMQVAITVAEEVAGAVLTNGKRAEFVKAYRARFLPAVNEALAIGAGGES